jgi:hypothetical protein
MGEASVDKTVELTKHHVKALRAVLNTASEIVSDMEEKLPEEDERVEVSLSTNQAELVAGLLEVYQFLEWDELPDGKEYRYDFDVVRDTLEKVEG